MDVWREFNDVRDVVKAYRMLLEAAPIGQIVNVCSSNLVSLKEALALATELTGHSLEARVNPLFVRANEVLKLGGDTTLLKTFVPDWQPKRLRETLAWMIQAAHLLAPQQILRSRSPPSSHDARGVRCDSPMQRSCRGRL
jgi:nucleoside-diphosphate-sugar epimerase